MDKNSDLKKALARITGTHEESKSSRKALNLAELESTDLTPVT
jgi:hypothetical protein